MGGEKKMSSRSIVTEDEEIVTVNGLRVLHECGLKIITADGKSINELFEKEKKRDTDD